MCYIRKKYSKENIRQGHLIELINKKKEVEKFIVLDTNVVRNGNISPYERVLLLNEEYQTISLDKFKDDLSKGDKVLYKVYSGLMYRKTKDKTIDIFSEDNRELIYEKDIIFLTKKEKELFEMLLSKVDKCVIFA